jgi:hypothetical protein
MNGTLQGPSGVFAWAIFQPSFTCCTLSGISDATKFFSAKSSLGKSNIYTLQAKLIDPNIFHTHAHLVFYLFSEALDELYSNTWCKNRDGPTGLLQTSGSTPLKNARILYIADMRQRQLRIFWDFKDHPYFSAVTLSPERPGAATPPLSTCAVINDVRSQFVKIYNRISMSTPFFQRCHFKVV